MKDLSKSQSYQDAKVYSTEGAKKIPVGNYKAKILDVKYDDNSAKGISDSINIRFDIVEGEYAGYYQERYNYALENNPDDAKWKGTLRLYVPKDDGTEKDGWTMRTFKTATNAIEESNPGYVWDWDENKWKDKVVGIRFCEDCYNGHTYAKPKDLIPVGEIETAALAKPTKAAQNKSNNTPSDDSDEFMTVPDTGKDKIPF